MADKPLYIDWDKAPSRELAPGVTARFAGTEHMMMSHVTMQAGAVVPLHSHPHEQVGVMLSGRGEFTIGGEKRTVTTGDAYQIPGGVTHTLTAIETLTALDVFYPPREDYLAGLQS